MTPIARVFRSVALILPLVGTACLYNTGTWEVDELVEWHSIWGGHSSPLYYLGSDDELHYFRIRSVDSWVHPRVERSELELPEVHPFAPSTSDGVFPGYYAVDPAREFARIEDPPSPPAAPRPTARRGAPRARPSTPASR